MQPLCPVPRWESLVEAPKTEASGSGWKWFWLEAGSSCPGGYWRPNLCGRDFGLGFTSGWLGTSPRRGGQTLRPRGGPWPSEQGCRARLAPAQLTGKLFETPQEAQASHPPLLSLLSAWLTGSCPAFALRCWVLQACTAGRFGSSPTSGPLWSPRLPVPVSVPLTVP